MKIGDIIEGHYSAEQTAQLAALGAHWTELEPRQEAAPRRTIRRWRVDANPPAPEPTPADLIAEYDAALEGYLRSEHVARGYTVREPSAYVDSPVPRYAQDAKDWALHIGQVMCAGLAMLNQYQQTGVIPSLADFLAALPRIAWTIDPTNEHPEEGMYVPSGEAGA